MVVIDEHDVGKTRKEVLMDLIYEATGRRIPLDKIVFGKPREVDVRKDLYYDPNTFIPVRIDSGYDDRFNAPESGILYRRRDLADHVKDVDGRQIIVDKLPIKVSELVEQINDQLKYPVAACEILDYQYDTIEQLEQFGLILAANPDSLLWYNGGTLNGLNVDNLTGDKPPLVRNQYLMGFYKYVHRPTSLAA